MGFYSNCFLFCYSNFVCSLWWNISGLHYLFVYYYLYNSVLYQYLGGFVELGLIVFRCCDLSVNVFLYFN